MMHGPEKSDLAIVAGKPANEAEQSAAESVERRAGTKGNANQQSTGRTQSRISVYRRWSAYGKHLPSHTQGGSRMRESRTYGSVRGACDETHVPTATKARLHHAHRRRGSRVAARTALALNMGDIHHSVEPWRCETPL